MVQCSHCQTELEDRGKLHLDRKGFRGSHRVGDFCSYSCVSSYIEEKSLTDTDLD